jgi:hypothetical protein
MVATGVWPLVEDEGPPEDDPLVAEPVDEDPPEVPPVEGPPDDEPEVSAVGVREPVADACEPPGDVPVVADVMVGWLGDASEVGDVIEPADGTERSSSSSNRRMVRRRIVKASLRVPGVSLAIQPASRFQNAMCHPSL